MLLGLCGRAGSGKSSVARYLEEKYSARRIAFAEPLKRMAMDIWGFTEEQVFGDAEIKEKMDLRWGFSPREALQRLGTEICREHLGPNVWIDALFARIRRMETEELKTSLWVIDDLRFLNEARAIWETRGTILRLHCSDSISTTDTSHASEGQVDLIPADICIDVFGSRAQGLPHLFAAVDEVLARFPFLAAQQSQ